MSDKVVWLSAARMLSRLEMAAAKTPASKRPLRPAGRIETIHMGKIASPSLGTGTLLVSSDSG